MPSVEVRDTRTQAGQDPLGEEVLVDDVMVGLVVRHPNNAGQPSWATYLSPDVMKTGRLADGRFFTREHALHYVVVAAACAHGT